MKQLNFNNENIFVGLDVHKKSWQVTVMLNQLMLKTFSQPADTNILVNYLQSHYPGANYYSAYEAGFCGFWIHYALEKSGINNLVVNPADVPTKHKERVQKEDKRDSRKIARGLAKGELDGIYIHGMKSIEDRSLVRTRYTTVKDVRRYKQRIKSFLMMHGIELPKKFDNSSWSNNFFIWLKQIPMNFPSGKQSLDILIDQCLILRGGTLAATRLVYALAKSESYVNEVALLKSIRGIGTLTAMVILTEVGDINRFRNNDHFCSFVGLSPTTNSSGDNENVGEITMRSNVLLRTTLIEVAWVAIRHDPALTKAYSNYCKRMESNKAIVRIAKKLACRIQFVLKNKVNYTPMKIK